SARHHAAQPSGEADGVADVRVPLQDHVSRRRSLGPGGCEGIASAPCKIHRSPMNELQHTIESAWETRGDLSPSSAPKALRDAVAHVVDALDRGSLRVAEKIDGGWTTHQWIKKAVLLSFRLSDNAPIGLAGPQVPFRFYDKIP